MSIQTSAPSSQANAVGESIDNSWLVRDVVVTLLLAVTALIMAWLFLFAGPPPAHQSAATVSGHSHRDG